MGGVDEHADPGAIQASFPASPSRSRSQVIGKGLRGCMAQALSPLTIVFVLFFRPSGEPP